MILLLNEYANGPPGCDCEWLTICTSSMQTASVSKPRVSFRAAVSSLRAARFTSLLFTSASGSSKLNTTQHCCSFRTTRPGWSPVAVSSTATLHHHPYTLHNVPFYQQAQTFALTHPSDNAHHVLSHAPNASLGKLLPNSTFSLSLQASTSPAKRSKKVRST